MFKTLKKEFGAIAIGLFLGYSIGYTVNGYFTIPTSECVSYSKRCSKMHTYMVGIKKNKLGRPRITCQRFKLRTVNVKR